MGDNIISIVVIFIGVITLILLLCGIYFYNVAIGRSKKVFLNQDPDLHNGTSGGTWSIGIEWLKGESYEVVKIKSYDGLTLNGYYIPASRPTEKTVLLIHGYSSRGTGMASFAKYYYENHCFNILMTDCRGHGESEGNYIGFGWHDRLDILKWIKYIIERTGEESQIILHGISMGGAAVLMTSGEELPENVRFILSDCAYSSVSDILRHQMKRMYKLPSFPLIQVTSLISKLRAGFYFGEASAANQVKKSKKPILFIHGDSDKFVPTQMVFKLFNAAQCEKDLLIVEGAGHAEAYWLDNKAYLRSMDTFIEKYIK